MLTYHGDQSLKDLLVHEQRLHLEADEFIQGQYEKENGTFRGCAVGCAIESLQRSGKIDKSVRRDDHASLSAAVAWPKWLWRLVDRLFEELPIAEAGQFAVDVCDAVPVGANLQPVYHHFLAFVLREVVQFDREAFSSVAAAVDHCILLHDQQCDDPKQWREAAEAAARAARAAAAGEAAGVARAAWAAAWAAAGEAAREEAGEAGEAREAAWAAAWVAAYQQMASRLIEMLRGVAP